MNFDIWDKNASARHAQMLSGQDISLTQVVVPEFLTILSSFERLTDYKVLDVGCGSGFLMKVLANKCSSVHGIDPSPESIRIAHEYLAPHDNLTVQVIGINEYQGEKFDLVISNMTMQVVRELDKAFVAINSVLSDGGKFVFAIPHPFFWPIYKGLDKKGGYNYMKGDEYQVPFTITNDKNPLPSSIPYIHRPLSSYSLALERAGYSITRVSEPFPSDEVQKAFHSPWEHPHFIFWICEKK